MEFFNEMTHFLPYSPPPRLDEGLLDPPEEGVDVDLPEELPPEEEDDPEEREGAGRLVGGDILLDLLGEVERCGEAEGRSVGLRYRTSGFASGR